MYRCLIITFSSLLNFSCILTSFCFKTWNQQNQLTPLSKEIYININEFYFLNLDSEYPIDHGFFNISSIYPANTPNLLTFPIKNNLGRIPITSTSNITRNFIKIEKILIETNYSLYVTLDQNGLSLIKGTENISNINLKAFFTFGTLKMKGLYCVNFAQILVKKSLDNTNFNELLIIDCNLESEKKVVFLKVMLEMIWGDWSFAFIDQQLIEDNTQTGLFSCNNRRLYGFTTLLFFFCPYSETFKETFKENSYLYVYSFKNISNLNLACLIKDLLVQDVQFDYKDRIIILDYYFGLFIYDDQCRRCSNIKFSRGKYLFILSRKEEAISYEDIQTYFYVATSTAVLEILYKSDYSLIYTKFFDVTLKPELEIYTIKNIFLTSKYLITLQEKVDKDIDYPKYLVKVYSIEKERESNILYAENFDLISAKFYPIEDQTNHNLIVQNVDLANENKVNLTAIFINERSFILTTQGQFSEKIKCSLILNGQSKLNPDLRFSVNFTIYLLTPNITNIIIYKENIVKNYNVNENYFEIPLYTFVIGAHINYFYLKESIYINNSLSKPSIDTYIYIDDYYNIVIEDKNFLKSSVILDAKMDINSKFLKILLHYSKTKAVFYLYCFVFSSESIGNCFPDPVYTVIKENITSFARDDDILFFYMKKINSVKICFLQKRICQDYLQLKFSSLDELIYVNKNLILTYVKNENNFLTIYFMRFSNSSEFDISMSKSFRLQYSSEFIGFDLSFIESGFLILKYTNLLRIFKIILINQTEYELQMGNNLDLNDSDKVLLLKNKTLISISYKNNYISEYRLVDLYNFEFRRNYLLYNFNITTFIESFTNGYLLFVSAIDVFSKSYVILIFNPELPLSQTLIKIIRNSHRMMKFNFLRTTGTLSPFYSVCLINMQEGQTYLNIINTQPYIYGYFSNNQIEAFAKNENYSVPINIAFGSGSRKLVSTLQVKFSYNESMINYSNNLENGTLAFNSSFKVLSNSTIFTLHPHFIFEGPIENYNATEGVVMEEVLQINQSFENSDFFEENLVDVIQFDPFVIVLVRRKILFFEMNINLIELKSIQTLFSDDSCQLSHHNSLRIFLKFCQTDNDSASSISVYNYTSLDSVKIGEISLPNSIGKIKQILLKDDLIFFITYLINNQNQERLTICNFTNMTLSTIFSPLKNFEAEDFNISAFKTFDFDVKLQYLPDNIIITLIFILSPNIIETRNFCKIIFILSNNVLKIFSSQFLSIKYANNETYAQNVEILKILSEGILCLISTSKYVYKILLNHGLSTFNYLYTYKYYQRCENRLQKPLFNDKFLISFCIRLDEGETIKDLLPIFRQTIPIFMVKIYDTENGKNSSDPIRILTSYNSNINYTIKAALLNNNKLTPKLIVSDVFSFLVEYDLKSNLTISNVSLAAKKISITASNRYGTKTVDVILPTVEAMNYQKLIIYIVYGCFDVVAVVFLMIFFLFGIKKLEIRRMRNDNSMLVDSNIIGSKSLNQSLLNRRMRKKTKKDLRTFE